MHMKLQELGGNSWWFDRFLAQHIAFFYYIMTVIMYAISPRMACKYVFLYWLSGYCFALLNLVSLHYVCLIRQNKNMYKPKWDRFGKRNVSMPVKMLKSIYFISLGFNDLLRQITFKSFLFQYNKSLLVLYMSDKVSTRSVEILILVDFV